MDKDSDNSEDYLFSHVDIHQHNKHDLQLKCKNKG